LCEYIVYLLLICNGLLQSQNVRYFCWKFY